MTESKLIIMSIDDGPPINKWFKGRNFKSYKQMADAVRHTDMAYGWYLAVANKKHWQRTERRIKYTESAFWVEGKGVVEST